MNSQTNAANQAATLAAHEAAAAAEKRQREEIYNRIKSLYDAGNLWRIYQFCRWNDNAKSRAAYCVISGDPRAPKPSAPQREWEKYFLSIPEIAREKERLAAEAAAYAEEARRAESLARARALVRAAAAFRDGEYISGSDALAILAELKITLPPRTRGALRKYELSQNAICGRAPVPEGVWRAHGRLTKALIPESAGQ